MQNNNIYDLVVIGGGAGGLFCALTAKKMSPNIKLLVVEKRDKLARKILISGNGRCNIGNSVLHEDSYNDKIFAYRVLNTATKGMEYGELLRNFGIETRNIGSKMDTSSWLYPVTEQSKTVVDCLFEQLKFYNTDILYKTECVDICCTDRNYNSVDISCTEILYNNECVDICDDKSNMKNVADAKVKLTEIKLRCDKTVDNGNKKTEIEAFDEIKVYAKKVILATGSPAYGGANSVSLIRKLGIKFNAFTSALCGLFADKNDMKLLDGQRIKAKAILFIDDKQIKETIGEVIFKNNSVNGICVMQLSRFINDVDFKKNVEIVFDFDTNNDSGELLEIIEKRLKSKMFYNYENLYLGLFTKNLYDAVRDKMADKKLANTAENIVKTIKNYSIKIIGKFDEKDAQIMRGGICLNELNEDMSLIKNENIYTVGEVTDIDGDCGGYNIMYAVCSAVVAGEAVVKSLKGIE